MGLESDDDQYQLTDYQHICKDESEWRCRVCGFVSSDKATVENCHPDSRVNRERGASVTASDSEHTGFVIPPYMDASTRELLEEVKVAVRQHGEEPVLPAAADVLARHLPEPTNGTRAFQVFTHLVWLQQYQALPGYPVRTTTNTTDTVTIREFCNAVSDCEGTVTEAEIRASDLLERSRIYRAKVLSVTPSFFEKSPVANTGFHIFQTWDLSLPSRWSEIESPTSTLFGEGTAHNTVVRKARNWLATHPDIDWVCAPHTMGAPPATERETQSPNDGEPRDSPVYMFDFAGFTEQPRATVTVVGSVIGSETLDETIPRLKHVRETTAAALLVVPNREAIHVFINNAEASDWLETPAAPIDDTVEHYSRQPSIQAVTDEFAARVPELDHVRFVTGKQLIDGIATPVDVLPNQFREHTATDR